MELRNCMAFLLYNEMLKSVKRPPKQFKVRSGLFGLSLEFGLQKWSHVYIIDMFSC